MIEALSWNMELQWIVLEILNMGVYGNSIYAARFYKTKTVMSDNFLAKSGI